MKIDEQGLNNTIEEIRNIIRNLEIAKDTVSSVVIPSDFYDKAMIKKIINKIDYTIYKEKNMTNWIAEAILRFKEANTYNDTITSGFLTSPSIDLNNGANTNLTAVNLDGTGTLNAETSTNSNNILEQIKSIFSDLIDYISSDEIMTDTSESSQKTATKIVNAVTYIFSSEIIEDISSGKLEKDILEWQKNMFENIVDTVDYVLSGQIIIDAFHYVVSGQIIVDTFEFAAKIIINAIKLTIIVWEFFKLTAATIGNIISSFIKGIGQLLEALFDLVVILLTAVASVPIGISDGFSYLISEEKDDWNSLTAQMWKGVMGFVANDYVGSFYNDFYKKTLMGQWLDNHALEWFKSDAVASDILSGIGYVSGIVVLTVLTAGAAGAAAGGTSLIGAGVSTAAGTGKYTQEAWGKMRDSSQGEEWRTFENGIKGFGYGLTNGIWEGVQWYVGGKLASWTIKGGSQVLSSAVRVGVDSGFNAADTPFRALLETIISDTSFNEAFALQGGWSSVLTNFGIGLIGSVAGEVIDVRNASKQLKTSIGGTTYEFKLDKNMSKEAKQLFYDMTERISIDKELGNKLEELLMDDDYVIGIHCAGVADPESILNNGLYLTGHLSSGVSSNDIDLSLNINFLDRKGTFQDMIMLCKYIEASQGYKTYRQCRKCNNC